jgi:hypothetical protein
MNCLRLRVRHRALGCGVTRPLIAASGLSTAPRRPVKKLVLTITGVVIAWKGIDAYQRASLAA